MISHRNSKTRTYRIWSEMKRRCGDPRRPEYRHYGGRGIRVAPRWFKFENFLGDMGHPPSVRHSLDRIDNSGDYEPRNCRWATTSQQANNRRGNRTLRFSGVNDTLSGWEKRTGIPSATIGGRLKRGWNVREALTTPLPKRVTVNGKSLAFLADSLGVNRSTLYKRYSRGVSKAKLTFRGNLCGSTL